jgi:signal transduction histidine kinase
MTDPIVILLVEDEAAHVEAIRRAFEAAGAKTKLQVVGSLREYRAAVAARPPDLALMDLNLPDGRALEVLTFPPVASPFPILIMTCYGNEQIAVEAMKAGALDYIVKSPKAFADLPRAVARAWREWNLLRERQRAAEALVTSQAQLRALAARLQAVREEERIRVAREIHDVLAQELTRLKMDVVWLNRCLARPLDADKQKAAQERLAVMTTVTDTALQSVQKIATELRPIVLDSLGLCAAVEWQARDFQTRTGIACTATVPEQDVPLNQGHSTALFRILQESLTNVLRHAQATWVDILLRPEAGQLVLRIQDNGCGIRPEALSNPGSIGLVGMRERAMLLAGQLEIRSQAGLGTTIEVRLPLSKAANRPEGNP